MLVCRRDEDGTERDERRWVPLETHDKDLARRRMSKVVAMLASGELVADAVKAEASRGESSTQLGSSVAFGDLDRIKCLL